MCNLGTSGTTPVVRCGEADAEENDNLVFTGGQWPAIATARVTALQLRYQASDTGGTASATRSATSSGGTNSASSTNSAGQGSGGSGGLSTGAKAAIGTVIPLVFILGVLAAFLLWRRRKQKKAAAAATSKDFADVHEMKRSYEKVPQEPFTNASNGTKGVSGAGQTGTYETPEWNAELDATEAERRRYLAVQGSLFPHAKGSSIGASSPGGVSEASELGGMMRVNRKPVAPVELDTMPARSELDGGEMTER